MKTFSKCSAAVVATAVWGLAVSAHAASIVTNGDFSAPTVSGSFSTNPPNPVPADWDVAGSVDLIGNYWPTPPLGGQAVDMDGSYPGAIGQVLNGISTGATYLLTFELAANPDGPPQTKSLEADVLPGATGITSVGSITSGSSDLSVVATSDQTANSAAGPALNWISEGYVFTASSSDEYLQFTSLDVNSPYGPVLADVAITPLGVGGGAPVPLPASAGVGFSMLAGFGGLAGLRKRLGRRAVIA